MSEAATDNNIVDLNLAELVNLAAKLLDKLFVQSPKDKAKPLFKDLKQGKSITLGAMTLQQKRTSELKLVLDYSEFKGPGFNYDIFAAALSSILKQISDSFRTQSEMNVMSSDNGSVLIHLPGAIVFEGQLNVMLLAFEFVGTDLINFKLMFVEPDQYEPYRQGE